MQRLERHTHTHTHTNYDQASTFSGCTRAHAFEHISLKSFSCGATTHLKSQPNQQSTHRRVQTKPMKSIHSHFSRAGQLCVCARKEESISNSGYALNSLALESTLWHRNAVQCAEYAIFNSAPSLHFTFLAAAQV